MTAPHQTSKQPGNPSSQDMKPSSGTSWLAMAGILILASLVAGFYGINTYTSEMDLLTSNLRKNSERFEKNYRDNAQTRLEALRLGINVLTHDREVVEMFARGDRPALLERIVPFFTNVLHKHFAIDQLNFFTPPAKGFLRANDVNTYGNDNSAFRKTLVAATEKGIEVSGMETGRGGSIALRAVVPLFDANRKVIGAAEMGDGIDGLLRQAAKANSVEFAIGLDNAVAEKAERPLDAENDKIVQSDRYFSYSKESVKEIIHQLSFNPRKTEAELLRNGSRPVLVRSFQLSNFSGVPTVVVTTVADLYDETRNILMTAAIKGAVLFVALLLLGIIGNQKFRALQHSLHNALFGSRQEIEAKTAQLAAANAKLAMVDTVKRTFFGTLIHAVQEPSLAIAGHLQAVQILLRDALPPRETAGPEHQQAIRERIDFATAEAIRLSQLVGDHEQLAQFRHQLVKRPLTQVDPVKAIRQAMKENRATRHALQSLSIEGTLPDALPGVRGDQELLGQALTELLDFATQSGGQGTIRIAASAHEQGSLEITLTGSGYRSLTLLTEAMMDEAQQFLSRQAAPPVEFQAKGALIHVALARAILEFLGGTLKLSRDDQGPDGFVIRMTTAS
ncbi:MAG: hypothetical protein G8237_05585 [Magnetococcales bacterium]|nr:hypothetical protein [Magnetococcales bacterium]